MSGCLRQRYGRFAASSFSPAIWQSISGPDQQRLVGAYMRAAGFTNIVDRASTPREGDPLWIVTGIA
jgi:hypothetical protein